MYDGYNAANVVLLYATDAKQYNIYVTNPYRNKTKCGKWLSFFLSLALSASALPHNY